jgi:PHD/YefM family antitoxin component YafN of YafNO toxin-antitoxin module
VAKPKRIVTTVGDLVRQFARYSDMALAKPVLVTSHGKPKNILISVEEYERLKTYDQQAFLAKDTPAEFVADLERQLRKRRRA